MGAVYPEGGLFVVNGEFVYLAPLCRFLLARFILE